ncbi:redoxin domain-containing protein [[Mycobacterium] kokjensenii]|uniref:Redoxin domain-containing protein n=1 Tax=[Mycobacterium] kokjensenii TaxID=3064287 RepID=A0ABN9MV76_9MYCO|nr:redoxin domain-containing protein [Mycolicibacter sp. MU0083]CAJ1494004.1 redoxin domain-containing protein [Mycolicibacter sp. MU0083]
MPHDSTSGRGRSVLLFVVATVLIGLIFGCGSPTRAEDAQLDFTAQTLDGRPFSGTSLHGRPAVLWFWAPFCPLCQKDAPMVARLAETHPNVTFVGVGAQDRLEALRAFVTRYGVDGFTELADTDAAVWAKFGVTRQPAYAFISPDGRVEVVTGSLAEAELNRRLAALPDS